MAVLDTMHQNCTGGYGLAVAVESGKDESELVVGTRGRAARLPCFRWTSVLHAELWVSQEEEGERGERGLLRRPWAACGQLFHVLGTR